MFGAWKCYYKSKSGLQKLGLLKPMVFLKVSHVYQSGCTCVSCPWPGQHSAALTLESGCLWAWGLLFFLSHQYVTGTDHSCFIEARLWLRLCKGFLPEAGTANREFLKNCPIITKQFLFFYNNVKLPSAPPLASGEAALVTWKKPLSHLSWESVFSRRLSFGVSSMPQVRPGNAWGFSSGGTAEVSTSPSSPPLPLSSECELPQGDSRLSGNASSCPHRATAAGRALAGLWHGAGVRSWELLTWGLTGALLCCLRGAADSISSLLCWGSQHHRATKQLRVAGLSGGPVQPPCSSRVTEGQLPRWAGFNCRESLH